MSRKTMEHACWIDWQRHPLTPLPAGRVYFGEETCELLLPPPATAGELARRLRDDARPVTVVTPFLTERGLEQATLLLDRLGAVLGDDFEVVCSDWGLLARVARERRATPVVGRLLAGQQTDPRLARMFDAARQRGRDRLLEHVDGTACVLSWRPPGPELACHLRAPALDRAAVRAFLAEYGVRRGEVNNVAQGLALEPDGGWSWSLHVPEVLVAAMRQCPGPGEDFLAAAPCTTGDPCGAAVEWCHAGLPAPIVRRGNALYWRNHELPPDLDGLPVNRLVWRVRER